MSAMYKKPEVFDTQMPKVLLFTAFGEPGTILPAARTIPAAALPAISRGPTVGIIGTFKTTTRTLH